jgi:phosphinothricin acetyltransferase
MLNSIAIRPAVRSDLPALVDIYNFYIETTPITFDIEPYTLETRTPWFEHYHDHGRHRLLIAERDGAAIGYASSSQFRTKAAYDTSIETSVYLHPDTRGEGIGSRLYEALFAELKAEDVHRAYAAVTLPNDASVRLHERFGFKSMATFTQVGRKFDRYWDVLWLERPWAEECLRGRGGRAGEAPRVIARSWQP